MQNLNAMNCFLLFVKVFKYVAVIPQMNLLFATLSKAGLDLLFFSAVFVIVVTGFAMAFYLAFGTGRVSDTAAHPAPPLPPPHLPPLLPPRRPRRRGLQ